MRSDYVCLASSLRLLAPEEEVERSVAEALMVERRPLASYFHADWEFKRDVHGAITGFNLINQINQNFGIANIRDFLIALAPFVSTGSFIDMANEQLESRWMWRFEEGSVFEHTNGDTKLLELSHELGPQYFPALPSARLGSSGHAAENEPSFDFSFLGDRSDLDQDLDDPDERFMAALSRAQDLASKARLIRKVSLFALALIGLVAGTLVARRYRRG